MPAPDLSQIVPPLAERRSLRPSVLNDDAYQCWTAPCGSSVSVLVHPQRTNIVLSMCHDSPAYCGLVGLVSEIRLAIGDAS